MQSSNKAESGGLNFVFESGSSGRENKKYVRSHAARVGWSQRSRKQAQSSKDFIAVTPDSTSKKRRKTTHQGAKAGNVQHQDQAQQHQEPTASSPPIPPTSDNRPVSHQVEAGPSRTRRSPSSVITHVPPRRGPANEPHFTAYSASHPYASTTLAQPYASAPAPSSSPSYHQQSRGHVASVHAQEVEASRSTRPPTSAASPFPSQGAYSPYSPCSPHYAGPDSVQHESVSQHSMVPHFRPATSNTSTHSRHVMPAADILRPVPPISPLPSPRLPPLANVYDPRPTLIGANWRQYDSMPATSLNSSQTATTAPQTPMRHDDTSAASVSTSRPSSPKRKAAPAFLELVLNEDFPMWKNVDSGSNSFNVFPVKWQPFYGRLLQNYRSNMLVQLDEILTGWTVDEKIEFNQMPLRLAGSEPSLFYSLLSTAAVMMPPGLISPTIPKWLQTRTVECLNQAFTDPKRAYSDATILALNMVALFESTSGNSKVTARTHQPVLRRMVDERGGLGAIAARDSMDSRNLVRFLAWTDRVIKCQTGNQLIFEDFKEEPSVAKTNWEDIWARMERRVEDNAPEPIEELPDAE
ncbi:hypothetical protein E4T43_00646 [Aureobasidium subglaciale]|nr:hypothetical protein E4T43_00646 [Aureobasidium subglaciale]